MYCQVEPSDIQYHTGKTKLRAVYCQEVSCIISRGNLSWVKINNKSGNQYNWDLRSFTVKVLILQVRSTSTWERRVRWTAYISRVPLKRMVWSNHITVSCHMTHHHLSSNNGLENGDRELGQLFCCYRSCKTLRLYCLESVCTLQQVFQECIIWNLVTSFS